MVFISLNLEVLLEIQRGEQFQSHCQENLRMRELRRGDKMTFGVISNS